MSCGNSRSSKCNPCGPSEDAMNAIAERAAYYARIAQYAAQSSIVSTGAVVAFAMNNAPDGWLQCDGSLVNRTTYSNLFTAIGITYGAGDGSTTFALPDLRGYFVRGNGTNSDGTVSGTFGDKQTDDVKPHTHIAFASSSSTFVNGIGESFAGVQSGTTNNLADISFGTGTVASNVSVSQNTGTESRPKNIAMLYCIKT